MLKTHALGACTKRAFVAVTIPYGRYVWESLDVTIPIKIIAYRTPFFIVRKTIVMVSIDDRHRG
jgi:hypothetical protein